MRSILLTLAVLSLSACRTDEPAAPTTPSPEPLTVDPTVPVGMKERDQEGPLAHARTSKPIDGSWYWTGAPGELVSDQTRYSIAIGSDGVDVVADCNRGRTNIERADNTVRFGAPGLTKMGCPQGSADQRFLASLADTRSLIANDNWALATNEQGNVVGFYARKAEAKPRTFQCNNGSFLAGVTENEITVVIANNLYTLVKLPDFVEERWGDGIYEFRGKEGAITLAGRGPTLKDCKSTP